MESDPKLPYWDEQLRSEIGVALPGWRKAVAIAAQMGVPFVCASSALNYYDSLRLARLPQNLTQAQRDCFGSHTYERVDKSGTFHSDWS